jgi:hypothetical protein
MAMAGMHQLNQAFPINTRIGTRCGAYVQRTDRFGTGPRFRFVCNSACGLPAKKPSKSCRMMGQGQGGTLMLPSFR